MYSRSYYPESPDRINLPENYDGTAFIESNEPETAEEVTEVSFAEKNDAPTREKAEPTSGRVLPVSGNFPILAGLFDRGGLLGGLGLKMPNIGTEEILILATAAFLFFSNNGDRECALILLLLLFIN